MEEGVESVDFAMEVATILDGKLDSIDSSSLAMVVEWKDKING